MPAASDVLPLFLALFAPAIRPVHPALVGPGCSCVLGLRSRLHPPLASASPLTWESDAAAAVVNGSLGRAHTVASRAKISAANKGKMPWNLGKKHSAETRRKIADRTRAAMLERKSKQEADLAERMERARTDDPGLFKEMLRNATLKAEGRPARSRLPANASASRAVKPRAPRRPSNGTGRVNFTFTAESKARISESLRRRWLDPEYRAARANNNVSEQTRQRLSDIMKEKWRDKEYRKRHSYLNGHSEERRRKIAAAIKLKWEDPEYRNRTVSAIRKTRTRSTSYSDRLTPQGAAAWKRKLSDSMKARWQVEEHRTAMADATRASALRRQRTAEEGEGEGGTAGGGEEAGAGGDGPEGIVVSGGGGQGSGLAVGAGAAGASAGAGAGGDAGEGLAAPPSLREVSPAGAPTQARRASAPSSPLHAAAAGREGVNGASQDGPLHPPAGAGLPPPVTDAARRLQAARVAARSEALAEARRLALEEEKVLRWGNVFIDFEAVEPPPPPPPPPRWLQNNRRRVGAGAALGRAGGKGGERESTWRTEGDGPDEADFIDMIMQEAGLPQYVDPAVVAELGAELGIPAGEGGESGMPDLGEHEEDEMGMPGGRRRAAKSTRRGRAKDTGRGRAKR